MRRPSFFDDFYSMLGMAAQDCGGISFSESIFLFSSRSKRPYRVTLIHSSAHPDLSIVRPEITTSLSTMSFSRTVNIRQVGKSQLAQMSVLCAKDASNGRPARCVDHGAAGCVHIDPRGVVLAAEN